MVGGGLGRVQRGQRVSSQLCEERQSGEDFGQAAMLAGPIHAEPVDHVRGVPLVVFPGQADVAGGIGPIAGVNPQDVVFDGIPEIVLLLGLDHRAQLVRHERGAEPGGERGLDLIVQLLVGGQDLQARAGADDVVGDRLDHAPRVAVVVDLVTAAVAEDVADIGVRGGVGGKAVGHRPMLAVVVRGQRGVEPRPHLAPPRVLHVRQQRRVHWAGGHGHCVVKLGLAPVQAVPLWIGEISLRPARALVCLGTQGALVLGPVQSQEPPQAVQEFAGRLCHQYTLPGAANFVKRRPRWRFATP